ncbi:MULTISPECIES: AMP-binding protein [Actinomadura]|uniref:AMP-binding protein n=1 Tax=Actinomadura yumaensis TaxID=111807 RepID=A0ABW2CPH5_9ACTN|nr:AMP-binding protein [Actinomadura sp. J1-007]MWK40394.1 AMP-binding protein [Actinomadura sp. J1-007]
MAQLLRRFAEARPHEPALVDERGTTGWAEFDERVNRVSNALRDLGLGTGDVVAIHAGNRREHFEVMAAASHIGLRYVLLNWHWTADELGYVLRDAGVRVLFSESEFASTVTQAVNGLDSLARVSFDDGMSGFTGYGDLVAGASADEPAEPVMGSPMFYTSGTTGRPKGVSRRLFDAGLPAETLALVSEVFAQTFLVPEDGRTLLVGPVYHSAQWLFSFMPLMGGRPVVMRRGFDPAETLRLIDRHVITNVHLVPTQFVRLLRLDPSTRRAFSGTSLAAVWHGAAPCAPTVKRQMIDWLGPVVHEYYGSTEASVNTVITAAEWLEKPGSVGRPLPTTEISVLLEDGSPAAPGTPGKIWFRYTSGDDIEYWGDEEKTASVHGHGGLFTTGDIGHFDEDGYLFLSDRAIDMIISGGVNIYPAEIEGVLIAHPAVADVAVFGIPDEEFGEQVKAVVQPTGDAFERDGLAEALLAHCREALAGYKVPRSVDFVPRLPRTPSGKLPKRVLRDPYWQENARRI